MQDYSQKQLNDNVNASTTDEIDLWRRDLQLNDDNKILVPFAWSHKEESQKFCVFPELIAVDLRL